MLSAFGAGNGDEDEDGIESISTGDDIFSWAE